MTITRRAFSKLLGVSAISVPALVEMAGEWKPGAEQLAPSEAGSTPGYGPDTRYHRQWRNGIPLHAGWKAAYDSAPGTPEYVCAAQLLLVWNPLLPVGEYPMGRIGIAGPRSMPHQFFYSNMILSKSDLELPGARLQAVLHTCTHRAIGTLRHVVRKHTCAHWLPDDGPATAKMLDNLRWNRDMHDAIMRAGAVSLVRIQEGRLS